MFIKFKQTGPNKKSVWNIANKVVLKVGENEVLDENWEKVKNHPKVLERIRSGVIEVSGSEVESFEKSLASAKKREYKKTDKALAQIKAIEENNSAEEKRKTEKRK